MLEEKTEKTILEEKTGLTEPDKSQLRSFI